MGLPSGPESENCAMVSMDEEPSNTNRTIQSTPDNMQHDAVVAAARMNMHHSEVSSCVTYLTNACLARNLDAQCVYVNMFYFDPSFQFIDYINSHATLSQCAWGGDLYVQVWRVYRPRPGSAGSAQVVFTSGTLGDTQQH